ncbi:MAG: hypothetical protein O9264_09380 [Leptospira sp.]|nr:hypothetical protein [Leptospira sp.]
MKTLPILLVSTLALTLTCSQMIWREAYLQKEVSTSSDRAAVTVQVRYQEKDSWNPLNGTTDKKNYTSKIELLELDGKTVKIKKTWEIPSWTLAESVFFHPESHSLILLHGKNDEYGSFHQKLSVYPEAGNSFSYPATPENLVIFQISPSPNGKQIAMITAISDENWEFSEFELRILDPATTLAKSYPLSFWTALPLYGMRWSSDSSVLFVRTPDRILTVADGNLGQSKYFPDCFSPSTSYGKNAFTDSFIESESPLSIRLGSKKADPKMIGSIDQIRPCP